MSMRVYKLEGGSGAKGAVLAVVILGVGALLVAFGLALLLALTAVGAVVGAGILAYRRLTGQSTPRVRGSAVDGRPDPALEVFADDAVIVDRPVRETPGTLPPG